MTDEGNLKAPKPSGVGRKLIIGVTGPTGGGKSTVAEMMGKQGCAVINADALNHEVLQRPNVIQQIRDKWGPEVIGADGKIDRQALGKIVFEHPEAMEKLTKLVHPLIEERQHQLMADYQSDPKIRAIVLDVPLLFEVGWNKKCDVVVFVTADEEIRAQRVNSRLSWGKYQLKKAENLQLALDTKAQMSDHIIYNNSGIPELSGQVASLLSQILDANAESLR